MEYEVEMVEGTQVGLFDREPVKVKKVNFKPGSTTEERFELFHENNPHVYRKLVEMVEELLRRGRKQYGIQALIEVMRFDYAVKTTGEMWKLNNNFSPLFSRLVMLKNKKRDPRYNGFFQLRKRKNDWTPNQWEEWAARLPE